MTGNGKRYSDWEQPIPASYIIPAVNAEMLRLESCVTTTFDVEIGLILLSEKKKSYVDTFALNLQKEKSDLL